MNNKMLLMSLALDLKRVSLGLQQGSLSMAQRFAKEALKRKNHINPQTVSPRVAMLLGKLDNVLQEDNQQRLAEDTLMYSSLFLMYAKKLE